MKKTILALAVTAFIAGTTLPSCQSSAEKVENAQDKVQEAQSDADDAEKDLDQAREDSYNEYQKFKKESDEKISAHEKSIIEFRVRIATEKKENRAQYEKKLAELEQKNSDMKKKMDEYKEEGKDKWEIFKNEFSHDMEELGKAFNDFTTKNVK